MGRAELRNRNFTEIIDRLVAETEHLIEECRLLAREIEVTKQSLGSLAERGLPRPGQRSAADKKMKKPDFESEDRARLAKIKL